MQILLLPGNFLLSAPDLHHKAVGENLDEDNLHPGDKSESAEVAPLQEVSPTAVHHVHRVVHRVEIRDAVFLRLVVSHIKEFCLCPVRAKGGDSDALRPEFFPEATAEIQHERLGGGVLCDIRDRLEGCDGCDV